MKKILIFIDYYLPGYKSGGALRTIANMVDRLGDRYDFSVISRGFDSGDKHTYEGIKINEWNQVGKAKVFHAGHGHLNFATIRRVLKDSTPDAVYLTSFFSPLGIKFLTLRRLGVAPDVPVILAPEGEFSPGALKLKAMKKKIFRGLAFPGKLYRNLIWKAASEPEKEDIKRVAGRACEIFVAPNMPPRVMLENYDFGRKPLKSSGAVRLVFLSRVMRKKNLDHTLRILPEVKGEVEFDIWGPLEDQPHWQECLQLIAAMPPNIKVTHRGSVSHEEVAETMSAYHFFVLPTLGENFGHVVLEAFSAGCPALVSDQTPWLNLPEKNLGWDVPLKRADLWREALQKCVDMDANSYEKTSGAARQYAVDFLASPEVEDATARVLERALAQNKIAVSSAA
ncbi:MAG: glycosyltransferase family 4 protein [Pyrinomonadaceae bacterium]|nr:glycosyltransferase family 4 protein [Pyrinomonadaceae bacterium]